MPKDRSLVRASDLSAWEYCNRAWWLSRIKGIAHQNPALLQRGKDFHTALGSQVTQSNRSAQAALLLLAAGGVVALEEAGAVGALGAAHHR